MAEQNGPNRTTTPNISENSHSLDFFFLWYLHTILPVFLHGTNHCIVTWMARALLGSGPVNTLQPNTHKATMEDVSVEECYCTLLGNSAPMKTLARNHVTCSLCGLPYATTELHFLCVVGAEAI
jgi:hypothetical protein